MKKIREYFRLLFRQYEKRDVRNAYLFMIPLLFVVIAFIFIPVMGTLISSFHEDISYQEGAGVAGLDGEVRIGDAVYIEYTREKNGETTTSYSEHVIPLGEELKVKAGDKVEKNQQLSESITAGKSGIVRIGVVVYIGDEDYYSPHLVPLDSKLIVEEGDTIKAGERFLSEEANFVGLDNYVKVFQRPDFWSALRFTLLFTLASVFFEAIVGMAFALLLNESFKGRGMLRTVILIPWAIPTIISAKTWQFMYDFQFGLLNFITVNLGLSADKIDWVGNATNAFWAIVITDVWKTTPFMVIILLAGLQAIPRDLYKQAKIDGCGMFKSFWKITLPLVRSVFAISLIFRTIDALRIFDLVYALTGGGPNGSTETLSTIGYQYFVSESNFGMGSTVSILTFIIAFIIALVYIKAGKFGESIK